MAKNLIKGANDYAAGMRASAERQMPEVCGHAKGGKVKAHAPKTRAIPVPVPMAPPPMAPPDPMAGAMGGGMPPGMKKGGKPHHYAMGGSVGGIRKGSVTADGAPKSPTIPAASSKMATPRFKGKAGIGGC